MRVNKKTISLSTKDIEYLRGMYGDYSKHLKEIEDNLARRLAEIGAQRAEVYFAGATYDGDNDVSVNIEKRGNGYYAVVASGKASIFIEFGSGLIGYGYPAEENNGLVPGSYSDTIGKGHWKDPRGWVYGGVGSGKSRVPLRSHGNPPAMAMYKSMKEAEQEIRNVVEEVFDFYT